ncbi:MAG: hypothetical protein F6K45_24700 [Kamptonema sp. SIO1D9]|nr:hypothetical protein [Kamptonema sp. SIO1D9]
MYYLAFFIDYHPFLKDKVNLFLNNDLSDVWIHDDNHKSKLNSLDDLPLPSGFFPYSHFWYLHGLPLLELPSQDFSNYSLYGKKSLKEIDNLLSCLASSYQWAIFPWGAGGCFSSFAFVSQEKKILDIFINCSFNIRDINIDLDSTFSYGTIANIPQCNLLISSYKVIDKFSEVAKAVIFDETDEPKVEKPGNFIWDACECDTVPPWLITQSPFPEVNNEFISPFLEEADFEFIQEFKLIKEEKHWFDSQVWNLGIYQAHNKNSFISMCRSYRSDPDTLVIVSKGTKLEQLKNLLAKTEANRGYSIYSDLSYLENYLKATKWFYGIGRDYNDFYYSLFISRDSQLIQNVNKLIMLDAHCKLISCF